VAVGIDVALTAGMGVTVMVGVTVNVEVGDCRAAVVVMGVVCVLDGKAAAWPLGSKAAPATA
jgi:limonene-1,2-epoxide hydrolase